MITIKELDDTLTINSFCNIVLLSKLRSTNCISERNS